MRDGVCAKAGLLALRFAQGLRLGAVHPHLPAAGPRTAVVQEAIGPAAPELGVAQMPHVLGEEASSLRVSMRLATPAQRDRTRAQDVQRLDETRLATRAARARRYQCWGSALPSGP